MDPGQPVHVDLDRYQTEEFADNNFKFDENGRVLLNIRNTVRKAKIARYE